MISYANNIAKTGSFSLSVKDDIVVYGGGRYGLAITQRLCADGYNVVAIIDHNPSGVHNAPVPVMTIDEYFHLKGENAFVYISLQDGLKHLSIAKILYAFGFKKILFLPIFLRSAPARRMISAWNEFFAGSYNVAIPNYNSLWKVSADDFILDRKNNGYIIAIVHRDYVYTAKDIQYDHPFYIYDDVGIKRFRLANLFNKPIYDNSIITHLETDIFPFSQELYTFLENMSFDMNDFYKSCAAPAIWNKNGYFNLFDGHHRSYWLASRGFSGLPLLIKKEDWLLYFRESKAQKLMDYCRQLDSLPLAIKHPAFVRFPVKKRSPDIVFVKLFTDLGDI